MNTPNTPGSALDDASLLRRIGRRDREAFSLFYDRLGGVLYSALMHVLNDAHQAGEVLQEVFTQIWDHSPAYQPAWGKPYHWAMALTRKAAVDRLRALRRRYAFFAEITNEKEVDANEVRAAFGMVFTPAQAAIVRSALASIPYEQRQAIEMAYFGGMNQHDIAEALGQPPGIISERIQRGMFKLRENLRSLL